MRSVLGLNEQQGGESIIRSARHESVAMSLIGVVGAGVLGDQNQKARRITAAPENTLRQIASRILMEFTAAHQPLSNVSGLKRRPFGR